MSDFWDEFQTGNWVSFHNHGDRVIGDVLAVRKGTDFNGNRCPELIIRTDDGEEVTLTAGQVDLKRKLTEERPRVGDRISVAYTHDGEGKPGKAPKKIFDVRIKRGEAKSATPAPAAAQADASDLEDF